MNLVLLTQDDPFFLADNLDYLFEDIPDHIHITGCVVFNVSPFGKKQSFTNKILKTWKIFGTGFLLNYGFRFFRNKLDKHKGVKYILKKHDIPLIELEGSVNDPDSLARIQRHEPDILVSIAGNQIFKKKLINLAPKGCLNLHTALLPKYRGLMPSFWVLKNDESHTGVSVFFVDEGIDSGPILVQKRVRISDMTQQELIQKTKKLGMDAIIEALEKTRQVEYEVMANNDDDSSYYSFPTAEDVKEFKSRGKKFY